MPVSSPNSTLESVNGTLQAVGIPALSMEQWRRAQTRYPKGFFQRLLGAAAGDPRVRIRLRHTVAEIQGNGPVVMQSSLPFDGSDIDAASTAKRRLVEINAVLAALGSRAVSLGEARQLAERFGANQLRRAISDARSCPAAAALLRRCVASLDMPARDGQSSPPKVAAQHRPRSDRGSRVERRAAHGRVDPEPPEQYVLYGSVAAVSWTVVSVPEQRKKREGYDCTVLIKAAQAKDDRDCRNGVAWQAGICVALSRHEVTLVTAVLLSFIDAARSEGQGRRDGKRFEIVRGKAGRSGSGFSVSVGETLTRRTIRVAIGPDDLAPILSLLLRVCAHQLHLDDHPALLIPTIRASARICCVAADSQQNVTHGILYADSRTVSAVPNPQGS